MTSAMNASTGMARVRTRHSSGALRHTVQRVPELRPRFNATDIAEIACKSGRSLRGAVSGSRRERHEREAGGNVHDRRISLLLQRRQQRGSEPDGAGQIRSDDGLCCVRRVSGSN